MPFISADYLRDSRSRDAFETAVTAAVARGDNYILPVLVGEVQVPHEMLNPQIGCLRAEKHLPEELAVRILERVTASKARAAGARDIGATAREVYP
jgi:hypothetical protein